MKSLVVFVALAVVAIVAAQEYDDDDDDERKKRSVDYEFVVPDAQLGYSSFVAPGAVYSHYTLENSAVVSPVLSSPVYVGGAAVSHQSRVEVKSSPAVVTEQVVQPVVPAQTLVESVPAVVDARSVLFSPYYAHHPAVVGAHSPTFVTEDLLFKKKRDVKSA